MTIVFLYKLCAFNEKGGTQKGGNSKRGELKKCTPQKSRMNFCPYDGTLLSVLGKKGHDGMMEDTQFSCHTCKWVVFFTHFAKYLDSIRACFPLLLLLRPKNVGVGLTRVEP